MPNYRYEHFHLMSPEPLKTAQFYEDMFNAKRVSTMKTANGHISNVQLDLNGSLIFIGQTRPDTVPSPQGSGYGLDHIGITTDNIDEAVANLKAKGAKFRNDEVREARPGVRIIYLLGPENVPIELLERSE